VRSTIPIGLLTASCLLAALAPAGVAQTARPCTTAELAGTRTPLVVEERTEGGAPVKSLRAGIRYRAVAVQELAIGGMGWARDGSFTLTASGGLALRRITFDGRTAWELVAPRSGAVRLQVSWLQESRDDPANVCAASASIELPVSTPGLIRTGLGHLTHPIAVASTFVLPVLPAKAADPSPVTVTLRIRKGVAQPAVATGAPLVTWTLMPEDGGFGRARGPHSAWLRPLSLHLSVDTTAQGAVSFSVYPDPNIPFGRPFRFGLSFEVRQGGRRIGGFRAGATCRRIQNRGFSTVRCLATGLAQQP
jgi:hypothetical protein